MKKNTFFIACFLVNSLFSLAQSYSTGNINLSTTAGLQMSAKIDVGSIVTLTLSGPSDRWFSLGFGAASMTNNTDVVLCHTATSLTSFDRYLTGFNAPVSDGLQSWTIVSNTVSGSSRTIVATRALNTGDSRDYVFSPEPNPISLIWARGSANNYTLNYHGGTNRGVVATNFTLGADDFILSKFVMYPNPTKSLVTINLPETNLDASVSIYDFLGRTIFKEEIFEGKIEIATSSFMKGSYIVKVETNDASFSKTLLVE